jgi:DNA-binding NtrC family response regulator
MKSQKHNIYLLGNNPMKLSALRNFLLHRFNNKINVFLYFSSKSFLRVMHNHVELVILDHLNEKENNPEQGPQILKSIKERFPETKVLIHTSNNDAAIEIESLHAGANNFIVKHNRSWLRIGILTDRVIAQPIKILFAEWGVKKFIGMFILTYLIMTVVIVVALKFAQII